MEKKKKSRSLLNVRKEEKETASHFERVSTFGGRHGLRGESSTQVENQLE